MQTHKIKLNEVESGMRLAKSVYVPTDSGASAMLAARAGVELNENIVGRLAKYGVDMIEIVPERSDEDMDYREPPKKLEENSQKNLQENSQKNLQEKNVSPPPSPSLPSPSPPPAKRILQPPASMKVDLPPENIEPIKPIVDEKLKEEAVDSIQQLFTCFSPGQKGTINKTTAYQCVSDIERVVGDLVGVLSSESTGLVHINDLKSFDEYTYHHSLSVAMLSMATGRELGLQSDDIFRLGRCAMMHDVGKQLIPLDIINKKGKLNEMEFAKMENHSILGATTLKINEIGDMELWNAVMHHHEKINGSGYPKGLLGKDIPLFSKIISVADVYDAITSYRVYRDPLLPSEAFEIIRKDIGIAFDYDVVKAFFEKLELYPVNTIVELSDGRFGIVVECDDALRRRLRPAVRIWGTTEIEYLAAPKNMDIKIVGVFHHDDFCQ